MTDPVALRFDFGGTLDSDGVARKNRCPADTVVESLARLPEVLP